MAERGDSAELEVLVLDDAPPPPDINAPVRRLLAPLRRWWRVLAVVAVANAIVLGVYIAVSVTGVRQVESTWHAALSLRDHYDDHLAATFRARTEVVRVAHPEDTVKEAARTYAGRLEGLLGEVADVRAVDPAVRRARNAVKQSLARRVADARDAASEPTPTLDLAPTEGDPVTHLVRRALGRFRLEEAERPAVAPLDVRVPPTSLAPVPTGARLVALTGEGIATIDVDNGIARTLAQGVVSTVAVGRVHVAWVQGFGQAFIAPVDGGPEVRVGRADAVWSAGDDTFWLEESGDRGSELRRVDATGRQLSPPMTVSGHVVGTSGTFVVTTPDDDVPDLHIWDAERGAVVRTVRSAHARTVAAGLIVSYKPVPTTLDSGDAGIPSDYSITRLDTGTTVRVTGGRPFEGWVMQLSADGSRLAVARSHRLSIVATDTGHEVDAAQIDVDVVTWSRDGRFVFMGRRINAMNPGAALLAYEVATRQIHRLDVTAELYELAAF